MIHFAALTVCAIGSFSLMAQSNQPPANLPSSVQHQSPVTRSTDEGKPWHHHPAVPSLIGLCGTVLAAIIAFKAFKGTLAFNRQKHNEDTENALERHAADLQNNLAKHRADRDLAIRKDIYFSFHAAATEAIFHIITILNRYVSLEATHEKMNRLAVEITKYQAAAGKEAMDAAFNLQEVICDAFGKLVPSRIHIEQLTAGRDVTRNLSEQLATHSERANGNQEIDLKDQLAHVRGVLRDEEEAVRKSVITHYEEMQVWMQKIQQPQINFIMIARRELGLELDERWFQERRDGMLRQAIQRLQETGF